MCGTQALILCMCGTIHKSTDCNFHCHPLSFDGNLVQSLCVDSECVRAYLNISLSMHHYLNGCFPNLHISLHHCHTSNSLKP